MIGRNVEEALINLIKKAVPRIASAQILNSLGEIYLEVPQNPSHGDLSLNSALKLSKSLKKNPRIIAESLKDILDKEIARSSLTGAIDRIQIDGPGFINFFIRDKYFYGQIDEIIKHGVDFGKLNIGRNKKVNIEFVSANPTGPLSVAHARQAAVGDSLARIMESLGFRVVREYYLNDKGNQIDILGRSIELRLREFNDEKIEFPENYYQGDYIKDIARQLQSTKRKVQNLSKYGVKYILDGIKKDLSDFGVKFDVWFSQSALEKSGKIEKAIALLKKKGFLYKREGAIWFKSSIFGDDKDRVIIKGDKAYTYLTPDIAYHKDKLKRGAKRLINLWGPDHHGYIARLKAGVAALCNKDALSITIVQLVSLYREGKMITMSTRKGSYITLRQIIDEVGKDVARFFLVNRKVSSHLDFDLELAKRESHENPVYYIQYAFARISSILRKKTKEQFLGKRDLTLLDKPEELSLMRKLSQFPYMLKVCLNMLDPYPLTLYLSDLAADFHKFYDKHRVLDVRHPDLSMARLSLIDACRIVLGNGLSLLGLSALERM